MWRKVEEKLKNHPERLKVARVLVENGLSIKKGKVYCNEIETSTVKIARVAKVDRRTVSNTVKIIQEDEELSIIFEHLRSAGHSLKENAKYLGLGVLEITPLDASTPGILAKSAMLLAERKISIRQALVDDPELSPEPKLTLIVETKVPGELVPELLTIDGVAKVSIC